MFYCPQGFAKKTLLKTARKVGVKQKPSSKRQKYVLPNVNNYSKYMTSPGRMSLPGTAAAASGGALGPGDEYQYQPEDELSLDDFEPSSGPSSINSVQLPISDAKTLERLCERSYVRDWRRLGLCGRAGSPRGAATGRCPAPAASAVSPRTPADQFRISTVNSSYAMCRSYPALIVVPSVINDDSVRRLCRCYRQSRVPCVTWRHARTHALLVRGAGHHGKSVMGMLKSHQSPGDPAGPGQASVASSSVEQERYLSAVVAATPLALASSRASHLADSSLSIDSLLLAATVGKFQLYLFLFTNRR